MKEWKLDLHIHTTLSPCGGEDMTPPNVLTRVFQLGLDVIAITDHNTCENCSAFIEAAEQFGLRVIPGMELQTSEDIHMVCLFDTLEQAINWQEYVYELLPSLPNEKEYLGEQWVVDRYGNKVKEIERRLLVGANISVNDTVLEVQKRGGICIAAHIDRQAFSLWGHLGHIPEDLHVDGVELTPHLKREPEQLKVLKQYGLNYIVSSDAHYLSDLRPPQTAVSLKECTMSELRMAFRNQKGRTIRTVR